MKNTRKKEEEEETLSFYMIEIEQQQNIGEINQRKSNQTKPNKKQDKHSIVNISTIIFILTVI